PVLKRPAGVENFIDWNGDGKYSPPVTLEGHQCLVFFLGGIPKQGAEPGCLGFSTDPLDPAKLSQVDGRKAPFYNFPPKRLTKGGCGNFYAFADPFGKGQPYAYFSFRILYGTSDCACLGVEPYMEPYGKGPESAGRYYN